MAGFFFLGETQTFLGGTKTLMFSMSATYVSTIDLPIHQCVIVKVCFTMAPGHLQKSLVVDSGEKAGRLSY